MIQSRCHACVQFLLEGQEEIGSPDFETFLTQNGKLLQADYALSADGGQNFRDQGSLAIGLRGAITVEVELQTLASDQHSGTVQHKLATGITGILLLPLCNNVVRAVDISIRPTFMCNP